MALFLEKEYLAIYGAGNVGKLVASVLMPRLQKWQKIFFIDDTPSKQGSFLLGIEIISKNAYCQKSKGNGLVIISIFQPGFSYLKSSDIFSATLGLKSIHFSQVLCTLSPPDFQYLFFEHKNSLLKKQEAYSKLLPMLSDMLSKEVLNQHITLRTEYKLEALDCTSRSDIDFLSSILPSNIIFIDLGAYNGDTILDFIKLSNNKYHLIHAVEPDTRNRQKIERLRTTIIPDDKLIITDKAVYHEKTLIGFRMNSDVSSQIHLTAGSKVETILLSEFIYSNPMLIKMDIEGCEYDVLKTSEDYLRKFKPWLAISVYHKPDDLIDILTFLYKLEIYTSFYLRCHGQDGEDLTLYCL